MIPDRILDRIDASGPCWLWAGHIEDGYGRAWINGGMRRVHRYVYEQLVGPIPEGMTLDHLCRVRRCVNPDHLEVVTQQENIKRGVRASKTHCSKGHRYDGVNAHNGQRTCRTCDREYSRQYQARKRAMS